MTWRLGLLALAAIVCSGQGVASHARDSYVLVLNNQAIARGPDFSQRAEALAYGQKNHLRDFVWFATENGRFAASDPETIREIRELEQTQKALDKKWARVALHPGSAGELGKQQDQHTARRDEFVWTLFDRLKSQGRLVSVSGTPQPAGGPKD